MEFDKEGTWDWSTQEEEKYDFFPLFEEEDQGNEVHEEPITLPPSLVALSPIHESPSSSSLLEGSSSERLRKMRSLQDLYDSTEITDDVKLFFCLLIVNL